MFAGDENTKICGTANLKCYQAAEKKLFIYTNDTEKNSTTSFRKKCNCLSSCTSVEYHADIDRIAYNDETQRIFKSNSKSDKIFSKVTISFRDHQ